MLVKVPAINDKARERINRDLGNHFPKSENGEDLQSVISEILNDKDLFIWMASFLPEKHGLRLGTYSYFDDIRVKVDYGLTMDFAGVPRRLYMFTDEKFGGCRNFHLVRSLPEKDGTSNYPTAKEFVDSFNRNLENASRAPNGNVVELPDKEGEYT